MKNVLAVIILVIIYGVVFWVVPFISIGFLGVLVVHVALAVAGAIALCLWWAIKQLTK